MAFWDDFNFGSFWGGLGDIGRFLGGASSFVSPLIGWYMNQNQPKYNAAGMGGQQFDPGEYMKQWMGAFEPPDLNEFYAGLAEQQAAMENEMKQTQMKGLARQAVSTRRGMQQQGVYDGGAVSEDALANLMGVDDRDLFKQALGIYGKDYGWV